MYGRVRQTAAPLKEHPFAAFHIAERGAGSGSLLVAVWEGIKTFDVTVRSPS